MTVADRPQMPKALLLGAQGKAGRALRQAWIDTPPHAFEIVPVARHPQHEAVLPWTGQGTRPVPGDVRAIIAMWGVTHGTPAELKANSSLAIKALNLAEQIGAATVLHCSSAAVYGHRAEPMTEDMALVPASDYAQSKVDMEQAIAAWHRAHPGVPVKSVILRIGNVAGADSLFLNLARGKAITLDRFGDGQGPRRSYVSMQDMARMVEALLRDPSRDGIFNIAAPDPTDMAAIADAAGAEVAWRPAPDGANPVLHLDTTRLARVLPPDPAWGDAAHLVRAARAGGLLA